MGTREVWGPEERYGDQRRDMGTRGEVWDQRRGMGPEESMGTREEIWGLECGFNILHLHHTLHLHHMDVQSITSITKPL